jgi:hypothetical protein
MITTHIDARPLKPSMMLTELAMPATANTVSASEPSVKPTSQSRPGIAVSRRPASMKWKARIADNAVAISRPRGVTASVQSWMKPARKAGIAQADGGVAPAVERLHGHPPGWRLSRPDFR